MKTGKKINGDSVGIAVSVLCAIHCAVLPLFFAALPVFGLEILHNKVFEYCMIGCAAAVGCYSLYHGFRKHHHSVLPMLVFFSGICLLISKELFLSIELLLLFPAAFLIITAHILNLYLVKKSNKPADYHTASL